MAEGSTDISVPTAQIPAVVINEIQFKPENEGTAGEFIELYNPGDSPVDVSGWEVEDAITYTIPNGTAIPAGGYLVIGEDPATLQNEYGVAALGPYSGNLSSKGERIDLRDSGGTLIDRVHYGVGFPWPSGTDGGGPSIERIHPALESIRAGSWRAAGALLEQQAQLPPFITSKAHGWRYKKGLSPASAPTDAWRQPGFDDNSWDSGQAAVGYNLPGVNTTLGDMANSYSSVYLRKEFTFVTGGKSARPIAAPPCGGRWLHHLA